MIHVVRPFTLKINPFIFPYSVLLINLKTVIYHFFITNQIFLKYFIVNRTITMITFKIIFCGILLMNNFLIFLIKLKDFLCINRSMQMNCVLNFIQMGILINIRKKWIDVIQIIILNIFLLFKSNILLWKTLFLLFTLFEFFIGF